VRPAPLLWVLLGWPQGHKLAQTQAGETVPKVSGVSKKNVTPGVLQPMLGRIAARAIRTRDPDGREVVSVS
jgi:hypothetical protein